MKIINKAGYEVPFTFNISYEPQDPQESSWSSRKLDTIGTYLKIGDVYFRGRDALKAKNFIEDYVPKPEIPKARPFRVPHKTKKDIWLTGIELTDEKDYLIKNGYKYYNYDFRFIGETLNNWDFDKIEYK